jgi:hypothetical protein
MSRERDARCERMFFGEDDHALYRDSAYARLPVFSARTGLIGKVGKGSI